MLEVHLYFIKVFGCIIVENDAPIITSVFADCILNRKAHKQIFIAFGKNPSTSKINHAGYTPIHSVNENNISVFASWGYIVDNIAVNVIYADKYTAVPDIPSRPVFRGYEGIGFRKLFGAIA